MTSSAIKTATNPNTGERLEFNNGKWVPIKTATNPKTGERLYNIGGQWKPLIEGNSSAETSRPLRPVERIKVPEYKEPYMLKQAARATNAVSKFANGATLGLPRRAASTLEGLVNVAQGEPANFRKEHEALTDVDRRGSQEFPISSTASNLGGLVFGLGKLQKAGATATRFAPKGFLPQTTATAVDATALGAVDSAIDGRNVIQDARTAGLASLATSTALRGMAPVAGLFRKVPKAPDTLALQAAKTAAYDDALSRGIEYSPQQMKALSEQVSAIAPKGNIGEVDSIGMPIATNALNKLSKYQNQPATPRQFEHFRAGLSATSRDNNADKLFTGRIRGKVDDFQKETIPAKIRRGTPSEATAAVQKARLANRRYEQSQELDHILNRIKNSASHSRGQKSEAIKSALRPYANARPGSAMARQFDDQHMSRIKEIVQGTRASNATQMAAQSFSPFNRQNAALSGFAFHTKAAPFAAAANTGGLGARYTSNKVTQRDFDELAAAIRNGEPIGPRYGKLEEILRDPEMRAALSKVTGLSFAGTP